MENISKQISYLRGLMDGLDYDTDSKEGRIYTGSFDDIRDYVSHGDDASRVLVRYYSGQLKEIVVYND